MFVWCSNLCLNDQYAHTSHPSITHTHCSSTMKVSKVSFIAVELDPFSYVWVCLSTHYLYLIHNTDEVRASVTTVESVVIIIVIVIMLIMNNCCYNILLILPFKLHYICDWIKGSLCGAVVILVTTVTIYIMCVRVGGQPRATMTCMRFRETRYICIISCMHTHVCTCI